MTRQITVKTVTINCSICNKPVRLETAKTDEEGKAVHAECYVSALVVKQPESPAATS